MFKNFFHYFDFGYFLRFVALFSVLYLGYTFIIAVSAPTGTYFPFVDHYLNFPVIIRYAVLHVGQFMLSILGYTTVVTSEQIKSADGHSILQMAWPCYGLGLKSFWIAFICAHKMNLKQKIFWSIGGVFVIFVLNCIRVTTLMITMINKWTIAEYLGTNAHDLFNYLCYLALAGLILIFYKKAELSRKQRPVIPALTAHSSL